MTMTYRRLGRAGFEVSAVGFGAWAIGGSWGEVGENDAMAALHAAADRGVNFFDTADVYGDGRSEQLIGRLLRERKERLVVATKMGRRVPLDPSLYTLDNFRAWTDRSRRLLNVERIDLTQLHCLGAGIYDRPDIWEALERLKEEGAIAHFGVSVETVGEGLRALEIPGLASVQVILNMLRQKPIQGFLPAAAAADVGVIARVPLASGLLTGKFRSDTVFAANDHRNFNREGQSFDVGETFSGVPYEVGLLAVDQISRRIGHNLPLAQVALRWVLMFEQVSTVIPGAKTVAQAAANAGAATLPALDPAVMAEVAGIYQETVAPLVHHRW